MRAAFPMKPGRGSITARTILGKAPVQIADVDLDPEYQVTEAAQRSGFRSGLGVPMLFEGSVIGAIFVGRAEPGVFPEKLIALLQTFADQAVIAIQNARLFNETQEALERQIGTAEILKVIASSPSDVQPVFDAIAVSSKRLIDGFSTSVFRIVDGVMHLVAFTPTTAEADEALQAMFPRSIEDSPPLTMVRDGAIVMINDTESDAGVPQVTRDLARLRGYRAMLFTPLMRNAAVIGLISVTRKEPGPFAEHHVQLLKTFADQAVIAIENVRLFNETNEALERQTATAEILRVISGSPTNVQPVFDAIAERARVLCGAIVGATTRFDGDWCIWSASTVDRRRAEAGMRAAYPMCPGRARSLHARSWPRRRYRSPTSTSIRSTRSPKRRIARAFAAAWRCPCSSKGESSVQSSSVA